MIAKLVRWLLMRWTAELPVRFINGLEGERYLERYFVFQRLGITCYVHRFVASDPGKEYHNHPWHAAWSLILLNWYQETRVTDYWPALQIQVRYRTAPSIARIKHNDFHRVDLPAGKDCWTIFWHTDWCYIWGFLNWGPMGRPEYEQAVKAEYGPKGTQWWRSAPLGKDVRL